MESCQKISNIVHYSGILEKIIGHKKGLAPKVIPLLATAFHHSTADFQFPQFFFGIHSNCVQQLELGIAKHLRLFRYINLGIAKTHGKYFRSLNITTGIKQRLIQKIWVATQSCPYCLSNSSLLYPNKCEQIRGSVMVHHLVERKDY